MRELTPSEWKSGIESKKRDVFDEKMKQRFGDLISVSITPNDNGDEKVSNSTEKDGNSMIGNIP